jgi:undecaprenyl-diphosphatase
VSRRTAVVTMAIGASVFAACAVLVVTGAADGLDEPVARAVGRSPPAWLELFMKVVTRLGASTILLIASAGLAVALLVTRRSIRPALWLAIAALGAGALESAFKQVFDRPRPLGSEMRSFAFPSGHSTQAAGFYLTAAALAATAAPRRRLTAWSAGIALAVVVAFSRVVLGVHWPVDVVGGLALGAGWAGGLTLVRLAVDPPTLSGRRPAAPGGEGPRPRRRDPPDRDGPRSA